MLGIVDDASSGLLTPPNAIPQVSTCSSQASRASAVGAVERPCVVHRSCRVVHCLVPGAAVGGLFPIPHPHEEFGDLFIDLSALFH